MMLPSVRIAICSIAVAAALPAGAQTTPKNCPEGRTASGACVDPGLAASQRLGVVVNTQPKLSYTAPPMMPSQDRGLAVAPSYHEVFNLYTWPPLSRPNPFRQRP